MDLSIRSKALGSNDLSNWIQGVTPVHFGGVQGDLRLPPEAPSLEWLHKNQPPAFSLAAVVGMYGEGGSLRSALCGTAGAGGC